MEESTFLQVQKVETFINQRNLLRVILVSHYTEIISNWRQRFKPEVVKIRWWRAKYQTLPRKVKEKGERDADE